MSEMSWRVYYWEFIKEFGKECYRTWRGEVLASLVAILFVYFINRNGVDVRTALLATWYTLACFTLFHVFRIPWILFKRNEEQNLPGYWGAMGIVFGLGTISLAVGTAAWFCTMQPPVIISTRVPDSRDVRMLQLQEQLDASKEPEPSDSLRRRTIKLADEMQDYLVRRVRNHPPFAYPDSSDPNPSEERKRMIQTSQKYDQETMDYYSKHFKDRMIGIIKEYDARGVKTGYLDSNAAQRPPVIAMPGSVFEGMYNDDLYQFRDLAYHVDARRNIITF